MTDRRIACSASSTQRMPALERAIDCAADSRRAGMLKGLNELCVLGYGIESVGIFYRSLFTHIDVFSRSLSHVHPDFFGHI